MFLTKCIFVRANRFFLKKLKFEKSFFYPTTGYPEKAYFHSANVKGMGMDLDAGGGWRPRSKTCEPQGGHSNINVYTCVTKKTLEKGTFLQEGA